MTKTAESAEHQALSLRVTRLISRPGTHDRLRDLAAGEVLPHLRAGEGGVPHSRSRRRRRRPRPGRAACRPPARRAVTRVRRSFASSRDRPVGVEQALDVAAPLPELLGQVRRHRVQELEQRVERRLAAAAATRVFSSSALVSALSSSISAATAVLNLKRSKSRVTRWIVAWRSRSSSSSAGAVGGALDDLLRHPPEPLQEAVGAGDRLVVPLHFVLGRAEEEGVDALGVGAHLVDQLVRRDGVALRLRHLLDPPALLGEAGDHPLVEQVA